MTEADPFKPAVRQRLARFADAFERLDASGYALFATDATGDEAIAHAMAAADGAIGHDTRRAAAAEVIASFRDWAARAYSSRLVQTDTVFLFQSLADRPEDRVRFAASLERGVMGLILWDELDPDDRAALLGPWATMAERVAGA